MIKQSDFKEKDIDQLIEEELENDGVVYGDHVVITQRALYNKSVESSRRKGMPGPPKWSEPVKCVPSRSENTLGDFAGAIMNLLVIVLISAVVVLVLIQAVWGKVW